MRSDVCDTPDSIKKMKRLFEKHTIQGFCKICDPWLAMGPWLINTIQ